MRRQVQAFSIDLQQERIQERARFQEYFIQDDWAISERLSVAPGLRYTLNFPSTSLEVRGEIFNLLNTPPLGNPKWRCRLGGVRHDHDSR